MAMHNNNNNRVSKHVWDIPGNGLIKSIIIIINRKIIFQFEPIPASFSLFQLFITFV